MPSNFFQNTSCEHFPCHNIGALPESDFNCLMCYCPLYFLSDCGGAPRYTQSGVKDCTGCLRPHYDREFILKRIKKELENVENRAYNNV